MLQLQVLHTAKNSVKAFEKLMYKKLDTIYKIYTNKLPELVVRDEKLCNYNILASVSNYDNNKIISTFRFKFLILDFKIPQM